MHGSIRTATSSTSPKHIERLARIPRLHEPRSTRVLYKTRQWGLGARRTDKIRTRAFLSSKKGMTRRQPEAAPQPRTKEEDLSALLCQLDRRRRSPVLLLSCREFPPPSVPLVICWISQSHWDSRTVHLRAVDEDELTSRGESVPLHRSIVSSNSESQAVPCLLELAYDCATCLLLGIQERKNRCLLLLHFHSLSSIQRPKKAAARSTCRC